LNIWQVDEAIVNAGLEAVQAWLKANSHHDVSVCDCCGNGENWYGEAGQHYGHYDPRGKEGPYAYNGGLCECN
jgi:hypothetical protein